MRVLWVLSLILGLTVFVNAQKDTTFTVLNGVVIDQTGGTIPDTKISLRHKDGYSFETYTNESGIYQIKIPSGTYIISAEYTKHQGWDKFTIENFEIASTIKVNLDITLRVNQETIKQNSSPMTSNTVRVEKSNKKILLTGTIYDRNGAVVLGTTIKIKDSFGKNYASYLNDEGVYTADLPEGTYNLEFEAQGFSILKVKNYQIVDTFKDKMFLDIVLEVRPPDDSHLIEGN